MSLGIILSIIDKFLSIIGLFLEHNWAVLEQCSIASLSIIVSSTLFTDGLSKMGWG